MWRIKFFRFIVARVEEVQEVLMLHMVTMSHGWIFVIGRDEIQTQCSCRNSYTKEVVEGRAKIFSRRKFFSVESSSIFIQ